MITKEAKDKVQEIARDAYIQCLKDIEKLYDERLHKITRHFANDTHKPREERDLAIRECEDDFRFKMNNVEYSMGVTWARFRDAFSNASKGAEEELSEAIKSFDDELVRHHSNSVDHERTNGKTFVEYQKKIQDIKDKYAAAVADRMKQYNKEIDAATKWRNKMIEDAQHAHSWAMSFAMKEVRDG